MNRRLAVGELLKNRGDCLVVAGLGSPAYDLAACGNGTGEFPTWGAMGGAVMIGLGLAMAQPKRKVLVLTGDGELLMGLGSLATVGWQTLLNLRIVVLDNGQFGETGGQLTHTSTSTDLTAVAQACGIENARTIHQIDEIATLRADIHNYEGVIFAVFKISNEPVPRVLPPRDGSFLTHRFRAELLGDDTAVEA